MSIRIEDTEMHDKECPNKLWKCPYPNCQATLPMRDMGRHQTECQFNPGRFTQYPQNYPPPYRPGEYVPPPHESDTEVVVIMATTYNRQNIQEIQRRRRIWFIICAMWTFLCIVAAVVVPIVITNYID